MLPEHSVVPVHPLTAGLTGLRSQVLKALSHYRQGMGDAGRSNIFASCCVNLLSILPAILVISVPAGVPNCWR